MNINVLIENGFNCNNRDQEASHSRRCDSDVVAWNRMDPEKISARISFVDIIQNKVMNREFHSLGEDITSRTRLGLKTKNR
jgi:hypothetical protein